MPAEEDADEAVTGNLSAVLDCLRFDLLQAVLDMLRGELSLRRIGLDQRIGTEAPPAVFVAPSLKFKTSQIIERRQDQSWLVRFLRGPSPNRYAALRIRAELAAKPGAPAGAEDLAFQVLQPSFIDANDEGSTDIKLASGQKLTVFEPVEKRGPYKWKLEGEKVRTGLPMEGVALLVETLIRWRTLQDDKDLRTIRASALAGSRTKLAELLHVFASGMSDVNAMLHDAHRAGTDGWLPGPARSGSEPVKSRVKRWRETYPEFIEDIRRVGKSWHPDLGCRFQFRDWQASMRVDLNQSMAPVQRGAARKRLQVDFEARRRADGPIRLSYFLPDVLNDGEFLRSVAARVVESVDAIKDYPTNADSRNSIKTLLRNITKHIDAGRVRLLRIRIGAQEDEDGVAEDQFILVIARERPVKKIRQVFILLDLRVTRHPADSLVSIERRRLIGMLRTGISGADTFRKMIDEDHRDENRDSDESNFSGAVGQPPAVFKKGDEVHDYFARLITIMHGWQVLIDGLQETQA